MPVEARTGPSGATAPKAYLLVALGWVLLPLFFLVTGGSFRWWEAWVYCALLLVPMTVFVLRTVRSDPELIEWRLKTKEKERTQRGVQAWGSPLFLLLLVLPGLDRRFGWSAPPLAVVAGAQAVAGASYRVVLRVFVANRWAGRTVETRPGQEVISTGPYAIVRHPMYAAVLALSFSSPLALGSLWALLAALPIVPLLVVRIRNEEEVLARELQGYGEYRKKVRFRLVPGLW